LQFNAFNAIGYLIKDFAMAVERRYQVFVSSTYKDLEDERREILQALLELDCIPSGMELFPAANDDQWTLIKRVIDDCDYYIVVIANRYGSVATDGLSFTEKEYRYALEIGKPIIGFIHKNPASIASNKTDNDAEKKQKLEAFRELVSKKMIKQWESPAELGSVVSRSLIRLIKDNPSSGWVKGDNLSSDAAREEILKLRNQIEALSAEINSVSYIDPSVQNDLARGEEKVALRGIIQVRDLKNRYEKENYWHEFDLTWNEIFSQISPILNEEASRVQMRKRLSEYLVEAKDEELRLIAKGEGGTFESYSMEVTAVETCIIQFVALRYIERGKKKRPVSDNGSYWKLTSVGEKAMYELLAIRKNVVI
jgi:Domain of unknown function (DUF4062)